MPDVFRTRPAGNGRAVGDVKKARALYPYSPREEDELQLAVGEEMFVLGLSQPDWLVCVRAGKRPADIGLVPQNYVTMCKPSDDDANRSTAALTAAIETGKREAVWQQFEGDEDLSQIQHEDSLIEPMTRTESTPNGKDELLNKDLPWPNTPDGPPLFSRSATRVWPSEGLKSTANESEVMTGPAYEPTTTRKRRHAQAARWLAALAGSCAAWLDNGR